MGRCKETEEFFIEYYECLCNVQNKVLEQLNDGFGGKTEHIKTRIKSKQSTILKLNKLQLNTTADVAVDNLTDIIGIRVVCRFLSDVYEIADMLETSREVEHIISKDYISHPKPNGYRSYHIIINIAEGDRYFPVEIQLRTISQDSWASLEHKLKYKKEIANSNMIKRELKRLADEIASTDTCMQTIKELIEES